MVSARNLMPPELYDDGSVRWMLTKSPRLALARAWQVDLVPFDFTIATTFETAGARPNLGVLSDTDVDTDVLLTALSVDVQDPAAFEGTVFKAERDCYFAESSGMQVAIEIEGMFRRRIDMVPLRDLKGFASEAQPWILLAEQFFKLDFIPTTALPFAGTTFTVSFIGKCCVDPNYVGLQDDGVEVAELRNCYCRTTLGIVLGPSTLADEERTEVRTANGATVEGS